MPARKVNPSSIRFDRVASVNVEVIVIRVSNSGNTRAHQVDIAPTATQVEAADGVAEFEFDFHSGYAPAIFRSYRNALRPGLPALFCWKESTHPNEPRGTQFTRPKSMLQSSRRSIRDVSITARIW